MAKKSFYAKFEDIPEADRADYVLRDGKYVLELDGAHPVQVKNTELLAEKSQRDSLVQTAVTAAVQPKDAEIARLTGELATATAAPALPAGQVAVAAADSILLNQFKELGEFKDVKAKVEEHGALKAESETASRRNLLAEAAKTHGFDADAFTLLAEPKGLADKIESREVEDGKGGKTKQFFVKGKDAAGADTATVLSDFVKTDDGFKPFLSSLQPVGGAQKGTVSIPQQRHGEPPRERTAAAAYLGSAYKRPDKKE